MQLVRGSWRRTLVAVLLAGLAVGACGDDPPEVKADEAVQKGLAAHVAGDVEEALEQYRKALKADDDNKFALYNIGLIEQNRNNPIEAEKRYRAALEIDPNFTAALFNLAILRNNAGAVEEAIALYRRVIAITPTDANAHLNLGFALKQFGRVAEGDKALAEAVRLNPQLSARIPKGTPSPQPPSSPSASPTAQG